MPLFGLKGKLDKSNLDPQSSSVLHTVWIKIREVPGIAREVDTVKEIAALVAEPLVVDELSLIRNGPVRVQGRCRNPATIKGSIEFFVNGVGTFLRFEVEGHQGPRKGGKGGPPGLGKHDDATDKDKDNHPKGDRLKRNRDKFDRIGKVDKELDSSLEGSMEEDLEGFDRNVDFAREVLRSLPIAAYHPNLGMVDMVQPSKLAESPIDPTDKMRSPTKEADKGVVQGSQPMKKFGESENKGIEEDEGEILIPGEQQIVVHGADGQYLMDKNSWPKLTLAVEKEGLVGDTMEVLTQEESLVNQGGKESGMIPQEVLSTKSDAVLGMGTQTISLAIQKASVEEDLMENISVHSLEFEMDEEEEGWQKSRPKKARKGNKKQVMVATRTSNRVPIDGMPIATKAINRAIAKDNISEMERLA